MFTTKLKVLQNVMTILEIETKVQQLMLSQGVGFVRKLIHAKHEAYRSLVDKEHSELFLVDTYQLFIFKQQHHATFIRSPTTNKANIIYNFTEEE